MTLRRPGAIQRAAYGEPFAFMIERAHFLAIKEQAGRFIDNERIVVPAVPEALHDINELLGPIVTQLMTQMMFFAEIVRLGLAARSNDIPAGAPTAKMIKGSKFAGDME